MEHIIYHIFISITTFTVTNIDDLLLLSIYFAHSEKYSQRNIIAGQYLGVLSLVCISLSGVVLGEFINKEWLRFSGLIPLYLGLKDFYIYFKNKNNKTEEVEYLHINDSSTFIKIALVTMANGGDNIGVYTPLFAVTPTRYIYLYISVFCLLIGVWCFLGKKLVSHQKVKNIFNKYGKIILPVFLIVLGVLILF